MTDQHPITPPPELVQQWAKGARLPDRLATEAQWQQRFALQAAQWGADQELEACCEWLCAKSKTALWQTDALRAARRPKPPSLKEQAFALLNIVETSDDACSSWDLSTIRRALEELPE